MKRILYIMAICCAASLFAQDNYKNYYWIGQYEGTMTGLTSWSEDETGYDNPVTVAPDENTILNVNKENKPTQGQLSNPARLQGEHYESVSLTNLDGKYGNSRIEHYEFYRRLY